MKKSICTIQKKINNLHLILCSWGIIHFYCNQPLLIILNELQILLGILFHSSSHMVFRLRMLVWFGFVGFYGISTIVGYLMPNSFLFVYTVLFQTIQFSISTQFSSIWSIDRTLSGATTLGQIGPGSNGNDGALRIPQSSSITETSPSYCLVSYLGYLLEESYSSAEKQLVYSKVQVDWAKDVC